jgi:hypothetical protein
VSEQPPEQRNYCPRCHAAYEPLQEYCLECGERLPTNQGVVGYLAQQWQRRFAWYPGDWIWPVLLFLVLTVVATAAAVAAESPAKQSGAGTIVQTSTPVPLGPGAPRSTVVPVSTSRLPTAAPPTVTTGPLPVAPGSPSTVSATTPKPGGPTTANGLTVWPAGKSGYTLVLQSLPAAGGRAAAVARARAAKSKGLPQVGVLVSSQYSSLHPGYLVVFSGIYSSPAEATAALGFAHSHGFPDAYEGQVTR